MKITRLITIMLCLSLPAFAQAKKPAPKAPAAKASAPTEAAVPIALKGGKVLTITKGVIENGTVVMEGGKITAVGPAASTAIPKNAKVIDVTGMTVYPGLIDSQTTLGLTEISAVDMSNDMVERSDEIMPHMHVADAFHAETELIPVTRMNGITNAIVAPASRDTLPGQDSFIQLDGKDRDEMLMSIDLAMPLIFKPDVRRNESFQNSRYPSTRMGMAAQLRQAFIDAQDYAQKWADYDKKAAEGDKPDSKDTKDGKEKKDKASPPKRDLKLEALVPYLQGKKPIVLTAETSEDVLVGLKLANEFHLKVILNGLTEAVPIYDQIAATKLPVIVGDIYGAPKSNERYDARFKLPGELQKRGVKIAFASFDSHQVRNLPYEAGYAVAYGLPYDEALKALTINPAEIWGMADKLGSLEAGKMANVVVANGDPLDVKTDVKMVFINGRDIPMESKQTKLRDAYMKR
jgi:imidazolonepropionase-like amidohydrolase